MARNKGNGESRFQSQVAPHIVIYDRSHLRSFDLKSSRIEVNVSVSYIPVHITNDHAKFGEESWLKKMQATFDKTTQKWDFSVKLGIFKANSPSEDAIIDRIQYSIPKSVFYFFQNFNSFYCSYLGKG